MAYSALSGGSRRGMTTMDLKNGLSYTQECNLASCNDDLQLRIGLELKWARQSERQLRRKMVDERTWFGISPDQFCRMSKNDYSANFKAAACKCDARLGASWHIFSTEWPPTVQNANGKMRNTRRPVSAHSITVEGHSAWRACKMRMSR